MKAPFNMITVVLLLVASACGNKQTQTAGPTVVPDSSTVFQAANIDEQLVYGRAFDAVVWGMPAVNFELLHESLMQAKGDFNQIVYWSGLIKSKNQTLTPNPDVIYINPLYDTRQGPVVLEIPPAEGKSSLTGSLDDGWQTAIEDVGPAGVDKGKGARYLILPPGYNGKIPKGYTPMPSSTYTGFAILRSNLTDGSEKDIARAIDYGRRVKIYPYAQAAHPPSTVFVDLIDVNFGNVIPYDIHFFELLSQFVGREPWLTRDMAMIDHLSSIGIVKGKPFEPAPRTREILNAAIHDAHDWLDKRYEQVFMPPFYEGTHWALPASPNVVKAVMANYEVPDIYPVDDRAVSYSLAYFSAKHLGTGQFYLMSCRDKSDQPMDGSKMYRLNLPANVPVKLYWSVTAYDRQTHALIKGMNYASRASTTPGLQKNADGSVDIYFGAKAPEGKESNWVPTDPQRQFELLTRFYGPEKPFFEKAWKMGDVEEIK
jgi:hypothetical protein